MSTLKLWNDFNRELEKIEPDNDLEFLKHRAIRRTMVNPLERNTLIAKKQIALLKENFPLEKSRIIEIGGGYGNWCRLSGADEYTIVDTPTMLRFSKKFLEVHEVACDFVDCDDLSPLENRSFDVLVSVLCLSETPIDYRNRLMKEVLPNCQRLFVINGKYEQDGSEFQSWIKPVIEEHFDKYNIYRLPGELCLRQNCNLYTAEKLA